MYNLTQYLTSDGKYLQRAKSAELSPSHIDNANKLLLSINSLFNDLSLPRTEITSGFRTVAGNIAIGGSKFSNHCTCLAIDLADPDHKLWHAFATNNAAPLVNHFLYMEALDNVGRVHLQIKPTINRIFKP